MKRVRWAWWALGLRGFSPRPPVTMPGRLSAAAGHTEPRVASRVSKVWAPGGSHDPLSGASVGGGGCPVTHMAPRRPLAPRDPVAVQDGVRGGATDGSCSPAVGCTAVRAPAWDRAGDGDRDTRIPGLWPCREHACFPTSGLSDLEAPGGRGVKQVGLASPEPGAGRPGLDALPGSSVSQDEL